MEEVYAAPALSLKRSLVLAAIPGLGTVQGVVLESSSAWKEAGVEEGASCDSAADLAHIFGSLTGAAAT